jgi:tetratricopeptide (TPR) repeat protein
LAKSGEKARQAYANQEAIAFYTHAIEVSGRISPPLEELQLLPVYEGRGLSGAWLLHYDAAIADFQHVRQLARALGNLYKEGDSLCHLAQVYLSKSPGDHIAFVEQYAQEAMHLFHQTGDQYIRARSLRSLGLVAQDRGNLLDAERRFEEAVRISRQEGFQDNLAQTLARLTAVMYWQGYFPRVVQLSQEGLTVARAIHDGASELFDLAILCLACWSAGNHTQALTVLHEGMAKAEERDSKLIIGRLMNSLGWFHRECGALAQAVEYDQESMELGRTYSMGNVEVSAFINLGLDALALGQHARALSFLEPTLDRVEREAFGSHRWRWMIRLLIGLAELSYATGAYDQAFRYVKEGLKEAQRTSSQKYVALGWAWRGKIIAQLGDTATAGLELQRAFSLAEQLQSPSLLYPIAYDLGHWYESTGKERDAAALYSRAKATIEQMATAVEDEALRSTFLQSALVQEIHERAARLDE